MIYKLSSEGIRNIAIRFSEFEGLDTVLNMKGKVDWVWVDCFSKVPLTHDNYKILKESGFKLCFVSPELQNQPDKIKEYKVPKKRSFFNKVLGTNKDSITIKDTIR
jgi:hypothetical protein